MEKDSVLEMRHIYKTFPGVKALQNVDFTLKKGEIHALMGENGAGKSTLIKVLTGVEEFETGEIMIDGCDHAIINRSPQEAQNRGISTVYQEVNLCPNLTVAENLFIGREPRKGGLIDWKTMNKKASKLLQDLDIHADVTQTIDNYSIAIQQMVAIARAVDMSAKVLILDEPTSQLDPIAAADFIATLQKLNRELGLTIILVEHRLEEVFPIADKVLVMENGRVLLYAPPRDIGASLAEIRKDQPMLCGLPSAVRIFGALGIHDECPLTVREGRAFLQKYFSDTDYQPRYEDYRPSEDIAIELKGVWFRYERDLPDILRAASLRVHRGEIYCVLGGNGAGKTTMLNVISGLNKAYRGKVLIDGKPIKDYKGNSLYRKKLAYLPQNPLTVFIKDNVREDFAEILEALDIPKDKRGEKIDAVAEKIGISRLLCKHPFDLSGGEQQKCAIAKMLLLEPEILLLDEPTKGLDAYSKKKLKEILIDLKNDGLTILTVTHDVEFAAENADRCALFFDGEILSAAVPEKFFSENNFYTTAANRMARNVWKNAVTVAQVISCAEKSRGICK